MKINEELCGVCSGCASVCPRGAISVFERGLTVDLNLCNNCGVCASVCPMGAITVEKE